MLSEIAWKSFGFATILKDIRIFIINNLTLKPFMIVSPIEERSGIKENEATGTILLVSQAIRIL